MTQPNSNAQSDSSRHVATTGSSEHQADMHTVCGWGHWASEAPHQLGEPSPTDGKKNNCTNMGRSESAMYKKCMQEKN